MLLQNSKNKSAHLALGIAGLFFGMNYAIAKDLMPVYFKPLQIVFLRTLVTVILFWLINGIWIREKIRRKDVLPLAVCGLTGISINQLFFFWGLNFTTPIQASLIHASSPILVMLFASLLIKERMTLLKGIGVILGALGAYVLISSGGSFSLKSDTSMGNILILINIVSYSFYLVWVKPLMKTYHPINVMSWVFLFGFLFVLPFSISSVPDIPWRDVPTSIWMSLIYVILVTTFITYLLTIFALKKLSATVTGYYIYIQPVVASSFAILTGKEGLEFYKMVAAFMIFSGIFLIVFNFKKTRG